ncbi:fungal-specific transcription factor domain-containing protein [Lentithecium fluviatile CBS 122367]|uniref:Fungal-specific transcription factor domain-containing protein n=1 Tax=Lentithecium fluviatile CBS 122367 TaxID=1168545 RepID=A0A6G1IKZ2_9PLEO|nr:fungal-specific transcription factor domain-containing protein [Lentithecium fluviatile CBS 122367]
MFTTFVGTPQSVTGSNKDLPDDRIFAASERPSPRPKRHQVARACGWCRIQRVKCDNNVPCGNCHSRDRHCSNSASGEFRSLPHAYREIERLRQRVRDLESQLGNERHASQTIFPLPPVSTENSTPSNHDAFRAEYKRNWEGVHISTAYSQQRTWYGPFSLFYFISRMNTYLTAALQQPHLDKHIQPNSVAKSFWSPDCNSLKENEGPQPRSDGHLVQSGQCLTAVQEEFFLNLFWESHHSSLPILNEVEFKDHCKGLWATPGKPRTPSALVDIVIAMSMQYGMTTRTRSLSGTEVGADDPTIAGRWYYRRCQALLSRDLESPTISTVQCQILSVIYLCCASFQNMAHSTLAIAVRTANMLGLHVEPPADMPSAERELRKRIWWSLYTVESKTCMKLDRPFSTCLSSTFCELPADDYEAARIAGSNFATLDENVTWLTYNLQHTKLVLAARSIHTALFDCCLKNSSGENGGLIYDDPAALKRCADFFTTSIQALRTWAQRVPEVLKTERKGNGVSFSTDFSVLYVEQFAPLWVQRQRLLLELLYHNLAMNLHRPFITFPTTPQLTECASLSHALLAAEHGMALTNIMHQIMTQTNILAGWHEAFQWQWNASITLVGYLLASPTSSSTALVRQAIDRALTVFEVFGCGFAAAASAAAVVRGLAEKVDLLKERARLEDAQARATALAAINLAGNYTGNVSHGSGGLLEPNGQDYITNDMLNLMDEVNMAAMQEVLTARPMDMAFMEDGPNGEDFEIQFLPFMSI